MGTKLQNAINPFSSTTSNNSFAANQIADWGYSQEFGVRGNLERSSTIMHHSMDDMFDLQSQKIESIKKTMLMHEDIFQRQVRELHWLYDRQMKLMCELKKQMIQTRSPLITKEANNICQLSNWQKQMQDIRSNLPVHGLTYDSGELQPSGGCSDEESMRMPKGFNLEGIADQECPSTSNHPIHEQNFKRPNSYRFSSNIITNNTGDHHVLDEEIDVELTLSTGCSTNRKRSTSQMMHCSIELGGGSDSNFTGKEHYSSSPALVKRERREDFGDPSPSVSSSSATQNKDHHARSNWFFQDLSLNRT